uniref:Ribosomal protein/NADH dehydrogenase domain-containing protein n=1 Tax=Arcella intermedia TaxID=1963864 RepID=A0A6B2LRF9_9EUKA|eukprot:TRINITY_DN388_c0_g1_i1.p1 TRINITY_DN388_c0_g1~~TRINITY_DN388_c0_g1_i1.p1  ORF type:complete len:129 (-),score=17.39 TRINITY_DN388_c0_g1_i1:31-417(-)
MSWIARASTNMREMRLILCHASASSSGARKFLDTHYPTIKRLNPQLPFYVRHYPNVEPRLVARYDYGGEAMRDLTDLSDKQVYEKMKELVDIGEVAIKANLFEWQQSYKRDEDVVDYDPEDPRMHSIL